MDQEFKLNIISHQLNSGLKAVIIPNDKSPIVAVNIAYKVGSKDEMLGKTGLAHLFEHLMFEGTKYNPKGKFDELCSYAGGTNNAYTTYDWTSYHSTLPSTQLELALWLESDRLYNLNLNQEVLDNQKKVVEEEIYQTVKGQPYAQWREYLASNAFSDKSGYSWEVQGLVEDVRNVSLEDAYNFHNKYYKTSNAVISVVGDVNPEHTIKLIEKYFSEEFKDKRVNSQTFDNGIFKGRNVTFEDKITHPAVFISFHLDGFSISDEYLIGMIYSDIMSRGKSSKLHDLLVQKSEVAQSIGAYIDKREHNSLLTIYGLAKDSKQNVDELYNALMEVIISYKQSSFFEKSLEKAKNYQRVVFANGLLSNTSLADKSNFYKMFYNNAELIYKRKELIDNISLQDLEEFMAKKIVPEEAIRINVVQGE